MINTTPASRQALSTLFFLKNLGTRPVFHKAWLAPPFPNTQGRGPQPPQNVYEFILRTTWKLVLAWGYIGLTFDSGLISLQGQSATRKYGVPNSCELEPADGSPEGP